LKRYLHLTSVLLFPYLIALILAGLVLPVFTWREYTIIIYAELVAGWLIEHWQLTLIFYILALGCSIFTFIKSISRKRSAKELLKVNMLIKLLHIPAYMLITISMISVFLWAQPIFFMMALFGYMAIYLTGLIGLCGIIRGYKEQSFSKIGAIFLGILQFVLLFNADAISAIIVYNRARRGSRELARMKEAAKISAKL